MSRTRAGSPGGRLLLGDSRRGGHWRRDGAAEAPFGLLGAGTFAYRPGPDAFRLCLASGLVIPYRYMALRGDHPNAASDSTPA
jgi:hypothetical protein